MWKSIQVFALFLCFKSYLGHPQYGNDLGRQISQQVQDSLRGLDHLGSDIQANVEQQLRASGIHNLGSRISTDVERQVAPLANLGAEIEEQVHRDLLPVYAMTIRKSMADGVGGTTVATYNGKTQRQFIIKNGVRSVCKGTIKGSDCDGILEPFRITNREDYCYTNSYAIINNNICLSSGPVNIFVNNNHIRCSSVNDNTPTLFVTKREFHDVCGNTSPQHVIYKYFANSNDPEAVPIPNSNPYVKCRTETPGVCEFEEDNTDFSSSSINTSNGNNISVRNGNIISSGGGGVYY